MQENVVTLYYDENNRDKFVQNLIHIGGPEGYVWNSQKQQLTIMDNGLITCYDLFSVKDHLYFIQSIQGKNYTRLLQLEPIPVESENYARSRIRGGQQEVH